MNLIPIINEKNEFVDGKYIQALTFCQAHYKAGKCCDFYNSVRERNLEGFFTCPYGMSVYYLPSNNIIYTSFREKETYNSRLAKNIAKQENIVYNPKQNKEQLQELINLTTEYLQIDEKKVVVDSISHEVKKLNGQIKEHCDVIFSTYNLDDGEGMDALSKQNLMEEIRTIYVSSSMIFSRFSLYDYEKNPSALSRGASFECNVYKKFDKIRKIFKNYRNKNVNIRLEGNSYKTIQAYPSFELIPLLLIDNAVKYAYGNNDVIVKFKEEQNKLEVIVESFSPYCSAEESDKLFLKGYRGKNAEKTSDGSGIGLYFVKKLCDLHKIKVSAYSERSSISEISGVAYAPFKVKLEFLEFFDAVR